MWERLIIPGWRGFQYFLSRRIRIGSQLPQARRRVEWGHFWKKAMVSLPTTENTARRLDCARSRVSQSAHAMFPRKAGRLFHTSKKSFLSGPVVLMVDDAIDRMNLYPVHTASSFPDTCPLLYSDLSGGQLHSASEQQGPGHRYPLFLLRCMAKFLATGLDK